MAMKSDELFGPLFAVVLAGLGIWAALRFSKSSAAAAAAAPSLPPGTVVNPVPTQDPTLSAVESKIPIIGPIVAPVVNAAGKAIVENQFLQEHSSVGPNKGQTLASAGILGVTTKHYSYTQVGHGIKVGAEATWSAVQTTGHYLNPLNW